MIDRLVTNRLVTRRSGAHDRRQVRLELSASGHRVTRQIIARRQTAISEIIDRMSTEDRGALIRGMTAFARASAEGTGPVRRGREEVT
jgi:DNA-binding MarR family transcriptional regulator